MLNLSRGLLAWRHWNSIVAQRRENSRAVDRSALKVATRNAHPNLDSLLAGLDRDGVILIENYWSREQCAAGRGEVDRVLVEHPSAVHVSSGGSDRRIFGIEMAGITSRLFHDDPFLKSIGELAGSYELYNFFTLGARIDATADNRGSGDGWHRDAFGFQFKAILYLSDVMDENGPFEYIPGSHKSWRMAMDVSRGRFPVPPNSRIDNEKLNQLVAAGKYQPRRFLADAGAVILVNTTGVHRGAPLKKGHRYALTNYYYNPYQIGQTTVEKFSPLVPGVADRIAPLLEGERRQIRTRIDVG